MESVILYIKESYNELVHKVTWPSWAKLRSSSVLVIIASIMIALVIFVMDGISKNVLTFIYNLGG